MKCTAACSTPIDGSESGASRPPFQSPALRYAVAACQTHFPCPKSRADVAQRVDRMLALIDAAVLSYRPLFPLRLVVYPDWFFPEAMRPLAFRGAEVLIRVSAYMDPWGATPLMAWNRMLVSS